MQRFDHLHPAFRKLATRLNQAANIDRVSFTDAQIHRFTYLHRRSTDTACAFLQATCGLLKQERPGSTVNSGSSRSAVDASITRTKHFKITSVECKPTPQKDKRGLTV